jgi:hypothetical protein
MQKASASSVASASCYRFSENVFILAVVKPELKFRKILLGDMVESSHYATLQERPERIDILSMNLTAYILANRVLDGGVFVAKLIQIIVALPFIGRDQIDLIADDLTHEAIKCSRIGMFDHLANHIAFTANSSNNRSLIATESALAAFLIPVLVLVLSTEITFVNFNNPHELLKIRVEHAGAQPMAHIPSGAVSTTADLPLNLKRANAFLGVENLPKHFKPSLQRVICVLKDGSRDYRKSVGVPFATLLVRAFPFPRLRNLVDVIRLAASRTFDFAVRPAPIHQELFAGIVIGKRYHQLFEGHHEMKDNTSESIRQARHNRRDKLFSQPARITVVPTLFF